MTQGISFNGRFNENPLGIPGPYFANMTHKNYMYADHAMRIMVSLYNDTPLFTEWGDDFLDPLVSEYSHYVVAVECEVEESMAELFKGCCVGRDVGTCVYVNPEDAS